MIANVLNVRAQVNYLTGGGVVIQVAAELICVLPVMAQELIKRKNKK